MARLGRGRPNRPILLRNPSFVTAGIPTGNLNVTLDAFTLNAQASFGEALAGANGIGNMVAVMAGTGPVAVGPNVVRRLARARR